MGHSLRFAFYARKMGYDRFLFFVFSRDAPTMAIRINDPGVIIAAAIAAEAFNVFCRLSEADGFLFATGYLRAPHD